MPSADGYQTHVGSNLLVSQVNMLLWEHERTRDGSRHSKGSQADLLVADLIHELEALQGLLDADANVLLC